MARIMHFFTLLYSRPLPKGDSKSKKIRSKTHYLTHPGEVIKEELEFRGISQRSAINRS